MVLEFEKLLTLAIVTASMFTPMYGGADCPKRSESFSRHVLEKKFGQSVGCGILYPFRTDTENQTCYKVEGVIVEVEFNTSDYAETIFIRTDCNGIHSLERAVLAIVPKNVRGKLVKPPTHPTHCNRYYTEEYECCVIKYFEDNCRGCMPASISITWPSRNRWQPVAMKR